MRSSDREALLIAGVVAVFAVLAVAVVLGVTTGWWSGSDNSQATLKRVDEDSAIALDAPDPDGTLSGSLFLITATPSSEAGLATPSTEGPPTATPSPPTATPQPSTETPAPATAEISAGPGVPPASAVSPAAQANFAGRWRVTDTVTQGSNAGETFTFDVALSQQGNRITGGNGGIQISGTVEGDVATLQYVQPALGLSGAFVWTMVSPDRAEGTFTNSFPNAGNSTLVRLQ